MFVVVTATERRHFAGGNEVCRIVLSPHIGSCHLPTSGSSDDPSLWEVASKVSHVLRTSKGLPPSGKCSILPYDFAIWQDGTHRKGHLWIRTEWIDFEKNAVQVYLLENKTADGILRTATKNSVRALILLVEDAVDAVSWIPDTLEDNTMKTALLALLLIPGISFGKDPAWMTYLSKNHPAAYKLATKPATVGSHSVGRSTSFHYPTVAPTAHNTHVPKASSRGKK